jgi:hypothetical protein
MLINEWYLDALTTNAKTPNPEILFFEPTSKP